jgi:hypothetical protein
VITGSAASSLPVVTTTLDSISRCELRDRPPRSPPTSTDHDVQHIMITEERTERKNESCRRDAYTFCIHLHERWNSGVAVSNTSSVIAGRAVGRDVDAGA